MCIKYVKQLHRIVHNRTFFSSFIDMLRTFCTFLIQ
jgi:hypothetical protein